MRRRQLAGLPALTAMLLAASCGGDDDGSGGPTGRDASTGPDATMGNDSGARPSRSLVCENPPPQEFALGGPVNNELDREAMYRCFWIDMPAGLSDVTFELTGLSADLELLLAYGFLSKVQYPGLGEFWNAPADGPADEVVVVPNPKPGPYFVYVRLDEPNVTSPFTVSATSTPPMAGSLTGAVLPDPNECAPPATTIEPGTAIDSQIEARSEPPLQHAYYCLQAPAGLSAITVDVGGLSDALEVLVRQGNQAEIWSDRRRSGPERTVVIDDPRPGAYFIDVAAAVPGASSSFSLIVSTE